MKNKLFRTSIIALAILMLAQLTILAAVDKLTLKTTTDKASYTVGEDVVVTVDWTEGMQAAVFKLNYDASKVTFKKASISGNYYNTETEGVISVNWASLEEQDFTKFTFTFTIKAEGSVAFTVTDPQFADGNLSSPSSYDTTTAGSKTITIAAKSEEKPTEQKDTSSGSGSVDETTSTTKKDSTTAKGKMPQTGAETTTVFALAVATMIGIVGLVGYKKISDF